MISDQYTKLNFFVPFKFIDIWLFREIKQEETTKITTVTP